MKSRRVRIWAIKANAAGAAGSKKAKRSYTVRWVVAGREKSRTFVTRALADRFRSDLMQAANQGEAFDIDTGLPDSMTETPAATSWLEFVSKYVDMKWAGAAAKSRDSMTEALAAVTAALVKDAPGRPPVELLRQALRNYVLPPPARGLDMPPDIADAVRWLRHASLPLPDLREAGTVRGALDVLVVKLDGKPAAATTTRRKRSVFYNALQYAVELEEFEFNPIDKLRVRSQRKKIAEVVDRRVVVNQRQAMELLIAVTYVGQRGRKAKRGERLVAFFACLYFAALRPAEALALREQDCDLPEKGWGRLTLAKSRPQAGKRWTDSGEVHDDRGLKHRAEDEPRSVPIPPALVAILRAHIERFGAAKDGRLFQSERGNVVAASTYSRVWDEARRLALTPRQVDSPLAGRPYDLRHAAVSLWLNAGVPATEVADRAGHSVDVLLKVYATCIDGAEATVNDRIAEALTGVAWPV
ncbi:MULTISPECIES: tyrosine-type recombinase/integrase [unclassified Micromonospora]|uniref:tyrosine-type recombinase/integrase n=1 Tax=unclassified Micromonospora TaxID=2617518 RepID=UPI00259D0F63|nr:MULTISPECIES: tyrosine-type recombinase/integrase [unclassified Micromonospora]MDM4784289.1 tyrosine-type recombinase/integrase [Micromonospora sp. b486]